jgi:uncharacterized membrane protein
MIPVLNHLFVALCGQDPAHIWAPGGVLLPLCQRCTGLYAGAGIAALLHLWLRPKLSGRLLEVHGAFLLFMVPFGFHWLPQGPFLRAVTGVVFGFGVFTFLWLPISASIMAPTRWPVPRPANPVRASRLYAIMMALTLVAVPFLGAFGGAVAAHLLSLVAGWGAAALAGAIMANAGLGLAWVLRVARPWTQIHARS